MLEAKSILYPGFLSNLTPASKVDTRMWLRLRDILTTSASSTCLSPVFATSAFKGPSWAAWRYHNPLHLLVSVCPKCFSCTYLWVHRVTFPLIIFISSPVKLILLFAGVHLGSPMSDFLELPRLNYLLKVCFEWWMRPYVHRAPSICLKAIFFQVIFWNGIFYLLILMYLWLPLCFIDQFSTYSRFCFTVLCSLMRTGSWF